MYFQDLRDGTRHLGEPLYTVTLHYLASPTFIARFKEFNKPFKAYNTLLWKWRQFKGGVTLAQTYSVGLLSRFFPQKCGRSLRVPSGKETRFADLVIMQGWLHMPRGLLCLHFTLQYKLWGVAWQKWQTSEQIYRKPQGRSKDQAIERAKKGIFIG